MDFGANNENRAPPGFLNERCSSIYHLTYAIIIDIGNLFINLVYLLQKSFFLIRVFKEILSSRTLLSQNHLFYLENRGGSRPFSVLILYDRAGLVLFKYRSMLSTSSKYLVWKEHLFLGYSFKASYTFLGCMYVVRLLISSNL